MLDLEYLADLLHQYPDAAKAKVREFNIGNTRFPFNSQPHIMGVINLSPDSWYRESVCVTVDQAVHRARILAAQGADLIDLGAESTLPHAARVNAQSQQSILLPVIKQLQPLGIPVSVETYDVAVAEACLKAGAHVLNLTGTDHSEAMFRLAAAHDAALILCHVQGPNVRQVTDFDLSRDPIDAMSVWFAKQADVAAQCGAEKIILDPGLGFYYRNLQDGATRVRHQMKTLAATFRLRALGFPVCHALPHAFDTFGEEVRCAEPFFAVLASLGKTDVFRTHEVSRVRAVLQTLRAQ